MPFALIIFGVILVAVGFKGSQDDFFGRLKGDFTGSGNFIYWVLSILVIGGIGYIPKLKGVSDAFLALILVVLFIGAGKKGFFAQFNSQIATGTTASTTSTPSVNIGNPVVQP